MSPIMEANVGEWVVMELPFDKITRKSDRGIEEEIISSFTLSPITITDEIRAGGRIPLMIGRALTDKVRTKLDLEPSK